MELRSPVSGVGTVVSGEASESDEEADNFSFILRPSLHGTVLQSFVVNTAKTFIVFFAKQLPHILAYKSKNFGHIFAVKVRASTLNLYRVLFNCFSNVVILSWQM